MSRSCPNNSTTRNLAIWKPEPTERGSFRILSTCTITLALCVWTAVHLKVPHRRDYRMAQFVRKTRWVLIRLLAPEIVALTALQQLATAKFISAAVGEAFPIVTGGARREGNRKWEAAADGRVPVSAVIRKCSGKTPEARHPWTLSHSHFVAMGGLAFHHEKLGEYLPKEAPGGRTRDCITVTADGFLNILKLAPHTIPNIPFRKIQDKSKGSVFAKTLVCIQAGWFCVQCITRLSLGLGVSLLELYVFAHAIMTLVTYTLWWNKPLDIEEAEQMLLPEETEAQDLEFIAAMSLFSDLGQKWQPCLNPYGHPSLTILVQCDVGSIHAKLVEGACTQHSFRRPHLCIGDPPPSLPWEHEFADIERNFIIHLGQRDPISEISFEPGLSSPMHDEISGPGALPYLKLAPYKPDLTRWKHTIASLRRGRDPRDTPIRGGYPESVSPSLLTDRVPNTPELVTYGQPLWPFIAITLTGMAYGRLHVLAWNARFGTHLEQWTWRVSSIIISGTGLWLMILLCYMPVPLWELMKGKKRPSFTEKQLKSNAYVIRYAALYLLGPIYVMARIYLVGESFANLVHLPDEAFLMPAWSKYVPHIG